MTAGIKRKAAVLLCCAGFLAAVFLILAYLVYEFTSETEKGETDGENPYGDLLVFDGGLQFEDGVLLDIEEVDIAAMKSVGMGGGEAALKIMEQFVDQTYRWAFVSGVYNIPLKEEYMVAKEKDRFTVILAGYPSINHLLYAQLFYDRKFFFMILSKEEADVKENFEIPLTKMSYDRFNAVRRNNVRDTVQRNNISVIGIE